MILVTGATGLVGSHLLYEICKRKEKVRALKRDRSQIDDVRHVFSYYTEDADALFKQIEWVDADVLDIPALEVAFEGVDQVYHCAGWISFHSKHRSRMVKTNVQGTENIVNLCLSKGVKKLCHVSSVAAIGFSEDGSSVNETKVWKDGPKNSYYAISKYQAELEVWRGMEEGLSAVIVNPSIILGPGNWNKGSAKLFQQIGKGMPFYMGGSNGFVDVRDVVKAMTQLMGTDIHSERFILNSENRSYKETFDFIADALQKKRPSRKISPLLSAFAWRFLKIISLFTGKTPVLTKETAAAGNRVSRYQSDKIKDAIGFSFVPVKDSCKTFSSFYENDLR